MKNRKTLDEGSLRKIFNLFLLPLDKHRPKDITRLEWFTLLFGECEIIRYEAIEGFEVKGLLKVAGNRAIQGLGNRSVRKGSQVWVRMAPNREGDQDIDMEVQAGRGKKEQVYQLTELEFIRIRRFLKQCTR